MKKSILFFIIALTAVFASAQTPCTVTGSNVRFRWGPSLNAPIVTNNYGRTAYAQRGSRLYCYGHRNGFCRTQYAGRDCWISSQYMSHGGGGGYYAPRNTSDRIRVVGTNVRLRLGPSLSAGTLTDYYGRNIHPARGAVLTCYGHRNGFCRTSYRGNSCWIASEYVRHF